MAKEIFYATNLEDYDGFMISGQPSSTFWHNDFSFTFDISIDLDEIGFGTENFPGMQIYQKVIQMMRTILVIILALSKYSGT